jgi:hypothetical protein
VRTGTAGPEVAMRGRRRSGRQARVEGVRVHRDAGDIRNAPERSSRLVVGLEWCGTGET